MHLIFSFFILRVISLPSPSNAGKDRYKNQKKYGRTPKKIAKLKKKDLCQSLSFNRPTTMSEERLRHSCFSINFAYFSRTLFLQNTSGRLFLSIAKICQEHLKLNVRRLRTTIFWSLSLHTDGLNLYETEL